MPDKTPPPEKGWLPALLAAELDRHDPTAARAGLPKDVRDAGASAADLAPAARLLVARSLRLRHLDAPPAPVAAFLEETRLHLALLLDLAVLREAPFDRAVRRAELAAFLAAVTRDVETALDILPPVPRARDPWDVDLALAAAETELVRRLFPPGDPRFGLPIHPGAVAILRRRLARVAMGYWRDGLLDPEALARHGRYAEREAVLLAETLAGLVDAERPPGDQEQAVRSRQAGRLGLSRAGVRLARAAVAVPRSPEAIAADAPEKVRPFLVEQLFLAQLRARLQGPGAEAWAATFVAATGLDAAAVAGARVEAAAQHGDHHVWFEALDDPGLVDWESLAGEWEAATDAAVERVTTAVTENFGAVVQEIRQTGELGQLLARAAAGAKLTQEERAKVRRQLVDLAKAVPALAIFAAPGGMLLLPLLAKLLPFNLLPSAWDKVGEGKAPAGPTGQPPGGGGSPGAGRPRSPRR